MSLVALRPLQINFLFPFLSCVSKLVMQEGSGFHYGCTGLILKWDPSPTFFFERLSFQQKHKYIASPNKKNALFLGIRVFFFGNLQIVGKKVDHHWDSRHTMSSKLACFSIGSLQCIFLMYATSQIPVGTL